MSANEKISLIQRPHIPSVGDHAAAQCPLLTQSRHFLPPAFYLRNPTRFQLRGIFVSIGGGDDVDDGGAGDNTKVNQNVPTIWTGIVVELAVAFDIHGAAANSSHRAKMGSFCNSLAQSELSQMKI